ncbi:hypothetical protein BC940DRAFT_221811, partial [Gongronella butleri]
MAPPNTENTVATESKLDLAKLAREVGPYFVFPEKVYPRIEAFEHKDPGLLADPKKSSILDAATKVSDVTPTIGTVIEGLQLTKLTEQQKNDLALLAAERGVLFFKKQDFDPIDALELGRYYGPLHIHNVGGHPENYPELLSIYSDENSEYKRELKERITADGIHSDITYEKQPAGLTFLTINVLPKTGGDTVWYNGYEAYDRLSPVLRTFLEGLTAKHYGDAHIRVAEKYGRTLRREVRDDVFHPVIRTHPVTGWKSLFVQPGFTRDIQELRKHESDALLKLLYEHIAGGYDFQVRHKWEVYDNRVTFHSAIFDYLDLGKRSGFRVTPTAEAPYFDPKSKSRREALKEAAELANK